MTTRGLDQVCILGGARTPFGRIGGELSDYAAHELGGIAIRGAIDRVGIEPGAVEELILGTGLISGSVMVPARLAVFESGLPETTPSLSVDRACCSGAVAVELAAQKIAVGERAVVIAGGMESMSQMPLLLRVSRGGKQLGNVLAEDILLMRSPLAEAPIAKYVGEEAIARGIDREAQDAWSNESHRRYFAALDNGVFEYEMLSDVRGRTEMSVLADEQARRDTNLEKLSKLQTVYGSPTVTAGNAPGLNDGAAAIVLASEEWATAHRLSPLARVLATASLSGSPTSSVYLPALAILDTLKQTKSTVEQLVAVEINEAFAATAAVSVAHLAGGDVQLYDRLVERTNPNGGAVAIGHPVGASGTRVLLTAVLEARRRGGGLGVAAICGGFGQADAILFETV